jgi:CHRD domain-containing protein
MAFLTHSARRLGARSVAAGVASLLAAAAFAGPADAGHRHGTALAAHATHAAKVAPMAVATLTGAKEVPGPGDPNGRGHVVITFKRAVGKVCANVTWSRIGTPLAAHIHKGGPRVSGDVVVDMTSTVTGGAHCVSAPRPTIKRIVAHMKRYYFNIHTRAFQAGAIRGQLHRMVM